MTTYLTMIPDDHAGSPGFDKAPFSALRGYTARCPKDAARLAAMDTSRLKYSCRVVVLVVRACDVGGWQERQRRYMVAFSRAVKSVEERK